MRIKIENITFNYISLAVNEIVLKFFSLKGKVLRIFCSFNTCRP